MTNDINKLNKKVEEIENRCKDEFNKYQNKNSYYFDSTNELYKYIKDRYIYIIDQGNLDIKI